MFSHALRVGAFFLALTCQLTAVASDDEATDWSTREDFLQFQAQFRHQYADILQNYQGLSLGVKETEQLGTQSASLGVHLRLQEEGNISLHRVLISIDGDTQSSLFPVSGAELRWYSSFFGSVPVGQRNVLIRVYADAKTAVDPFSSRPRRLVGEGFAPVFVGEQGEVAAFQVKVNPKGWLGSELHVDVQRILSKK